ncbi:MAG TPA: class I SAM-dependent methyltransferase [Flavobacteriales bacterium]|jgi:SAM-dependent methyltransferase|nr:class I SAM-dependent methyltransferase [Flavobacteriales bacterium]HHZ97216.1 class I SAM-dependent methyltransferase [Flavobacteriales bacterium]HIB78023.1 class I SAM-dependent methyltransferase [Flavobacteriales bacterium]HIN41022.1 class I SAM-dependent methyltransferase [Flavobacteriales bacterium]HIO16239.1 class I SAM-dependent methyltransferase [Flavobacteriales bacterium]
MKGHWNERYAENEAAYGRKPNKFFATSLGELENSDSDGGKSLLLPCDGEGRNAVYAAKRGWDVCSFDNSTVGVEKSNRWASEAGVEIDSKLADAFEFKPERKFDVVALIFAHMPLEMRLTFHNRVKNWLTPGGTLIIEGFHKDQLGLGSGGPKKLDMLFDEETIRDDFSEFEILSIIKTIQTLDEGPFHQGKAITLQFRAKSLT